ncbi:zinc finger (c3hc4 ring finger) [Stylonychia lemnae]|uniref:RING-type E3 ubiquitin transferase n=1 Tax=Stylonychia lemnae TaxID=5949 RepID=A0A078AGB5_STYLE|nr:zinc finger (c3hc4 ring finger) [Stylonychia lemnae]|eukprot:CDW80562.1 zinc finger (c3hc4 ring finger) [Stylonychia lemnae]
MDKLKSQPQSSNHISESNQQIHDPLSDVIIKAEIGRNAHGQPTFNGYSRQQIVDYKFRDLNFYQMTCGPRKLKDEDQDEEIDLECFNQIKEILHCPVCYDILKEPLNVKMCLHKFCRHCIENYNRTVKKQCPQCRNPVGSRRLLKTDYKLTYIIKALITDIDAYNKFEEESRQQVVPKIHDFENFRKKCQGIQFDQEQKQFQADLLQGIKKKGKLGAISARRLIEECKEDTEEEDNPELPFDTDNIIELQDEEENIQRQVNATIVVSRGRPPNRRNSGGKRGKKRRGDYGGHKSDYGMNLISINNVSNSRNQQEEKKQSQQSNQSKGKSNMKIVIGINNTSSSHTLNQSRNRSSLITISNHTSNQKLGGVGSKRTLKFSQNNTTRGAYFGALSTTSTLQNALKQESPVIKKGKRGRKPNLKNQDFIMLGSDDMLQVDDSSEELQLRLGMASNTNKRLKRNERSLSNFNTDIQQVPKAQINEHSIVEFSIRQEYIQPQSKDFNLNSDNFNKPRFQDAVLRTKSIINVQQLKKYVKDKLTMAYSYQVELNEIEIYISINGEKTQVLVNKQTILDLVQRNLWKYEKLIPKQQNEFDVYNYWNSEQPDDKIREILWVKIKHGSF